MDTPQPIPSCHACKHRMRQPDTPRAEELATHGFYNCRHLPLQTYCSERARCAFSPSRFEPQPKDDKS